MPEDHDWFPLMLVPVGLFFLALGLRGIISRKPFVISSWWIIAGLFFCFLPAMLPLLFTGSFEPFDLFFFALLAVVFVVVVLQLRGYTAYCVTNRSLREGLFAALEKLNLPFEETLGSVRLPTLGTDLQVTSHAWMGTALLRPRPFKPAELKAIIQGMNDYYRSNPAEINLTNSILDLVIGTAFLLMQVYFLKLLD